MTQVILIRVLLVAGLAGEWPEPRVGVATVARMIAMALRRPIRAVLGSLGCTRGSVPVAGEERFVYHRSMNVRDADTAVALIAAAIAAPARARMLFSLVDGRARTSTELAAVAEVSPSTASAHLQRLK